MSGREHDHDTTRAVEDVRPPLRGDHAPAKVTRKLDNDAAWPRVDAVLKGNKKDLAQLPLLVTFLESERQNELWMDRFEELKKLGGDNVLEVLRALQHSPGFVVESALKSTPKVSAAKLRRYLRSLSGADLAEIEIYPEIRKLLTGKLIEELPEVIKRFDLIASSRQLVRWLADTTDVKLLAPIFAEHGSSELAATLNAENLWTWVDHLPAARGYVRLTRLREGAKDDVKLKIDTMLGPMATDDYDNIAKVRAANRDELRSAIDGNEKLDRAKLMELVGSAGYMANELSFERLVKLLRRARLSADDVVDVLVAMNVDVAKGLPVVLDSDGVTKSHVIRFAAGRLDLLAVLRNDKIRNALRNKLGGGIGVRDLLGDIGEDEQKALLEDEALRRWYLTDATPEDLLALCGGSASRSARACRLVKQARGLDWVFQLTPAATKAELRVLATHCGDAKIAAFIRNALIADATSEQPATIGAAASDPAIYGGEKTRLRDAVKTRDDDDVLARLSDMDDQQRAALARDHVSLPGVLKEVGRDNRLRALHLLDLPFGETVAFAAPDTGFERQLVLHLRTRSVAEETKVLEVRELVERAIFHVHPDPLQTFPALLEPTVLAKAVDVCPPIVERMLAGSESSRALRLLGHRDVRKKFESILDARPELIDLMPRYQHLDAKAQERLDRTADALPAGTEAEDALAEVQAGTYDGDRRREADGAVQSKARDKAKTSVADAILVLSGEGGDTAGAMALIAERHDEIVAMLDDATSWLVIEKLARLVDLPPNFVFKVGLDRLLMLRNVRRWFFEVTPAFVLLQQLRAVKGAALVAIADAVNRELPGSPGWLERLPVGAALTDQEELTLDVIQNHVSNDEPLRMLFKVRFGIRPPDLEAKGLKSMYRTLSRLPDAHVQQERIKEIKHEHVKGDYGGYWSQGRGEIVIDDDVKPGQGTEELSPRSGAMTREQVRASYGWDDATIDAYVKEGRLEQKEEGGQTLFELPVIRDLDKFTQVLLHEVGHSVDSILGTRTEAVFDLAGWRVYDEGDFDRWASEMGDWDKVPESDRVRIRQAWLDALKSSLPVESMVDEDHPARAKKYAGIGIVDALRRGEGGRFTDPITSNGRTFIMQPYYGLFFSLKAEAASVAPSAYSLYAPQEYFAECYVEYYRLVDGTPAGTKRKGGMLPAPLKKWFDTHVDNVRFDPKRLTKPDGSP